MKSEWVAGFSLECTAGFVGICSVSARKGGFVIAGS